MAVIIIRRPSVAAKPVQAKEYHSGQTANHGCFCLTTMHLL